MNEEDKNNLETEQHLKDVAEKLKQTTLFGNNTDLGKNAEKQLIFLAAAGIKPVSEAVSVHWAKTEDGRKSVPDDPEEVGKFLDELQLKYVIRTDEWATSATVSTSQENIDNYMNASGHDIGNYYGFPKSAVEAFKTGNTLSDEEQEKIEEDYLDEDSREFLTFRLSKDNWRVELETAKLFSETLKKYNMLRF